jgi:hypothetical protein
MKSFIAIALFLLFTVGSAQAQLGGLLAPPGGVSDGGMTSGTIPKYDGDELVDSLLDDDGTNVRLTSGDIILGVDGTSQLRSYSGGSTYGAAAIRFNANYSETEFYFNGTKRAVINMGQAFLTDSVNIGTTPANANQITIRRISTGRLELGTYTAGQMSVSITTGVVAGSGITKATNYEELDIIADNAGTISLEAKSAGTGSDNIDIVLSSLGTGEIQMDAGGIQFRVKSTAAVNWTPRSAAPTSAAAGDTYYDSDSNEFCVYNGSTWTGLIGAGACV